MKMISKKNKRGDGGSTRPSRYSKANKSSSIRMKYNEKKTPRERIKK